MLEGNSALGESLENFRQLLAAVVTPRPAGQWRTFSLRPNGCLVPSAN
jgi:hypothetical protein